MTTSDRQSCLDVMKDAIRARQALSPQSRWEWAVLVTVDHAEMQVARQVLLELETDGAKFIICCPPQRPQALRGHLGPVFFTPRAHALNLFFEETKARNAAFWSSMVAAFWDPAMDSRSRHWPPKVASEVKGPEDQEVPHE